MFHSIHVLWPGALDRMALWDCVAWGLVRPKAEAQQKKVRIVFVALKPHKMTFLNIFHDRSHVFVRPMCKREKRAGTGGRDV